MAPNAAAVASPPTFKLPVLVASPVDVGRLIRELETIDGALLQIKLQNDSSKTVTKTSHLLSQTLQLNNLELGKDDDRKQLRQSLELVKTKAPVLHISFSADPNPVFTEKLMTWLRREIHPSVLLTVGLQPNIGAGCVVRSTNKYFDFSLRKDFEKKRDLLLGTLGSAEVAAARTDSLAVPVIAPATRPVAATAVAATAEAVA